MDGARNWQRTIGQRLGDFGKPRSQKPDSEELKGMFISAGYLSLLLRRNDIAACYRLSINCFLSDNRPIRMNIPSGAIASSIFACLRGPHLKHRGPSPASVASPTRELEARMSSMRIHDDIQRMDSSNRSANTPDLSGIPRQCGFQPRAGSQSHVPPFAIRVTCP